MASPAVKKPPVVTMPKPPRDRYSPKATTGAAPAAAAAAVGATGGTPLMHTSSVKKLSNPPSKAMSSMPSIQGSPVTAMNSLLDSASESTLDAAEAAQPRLERRRSIGAGSRRASLAPSTQGSLSDKSEGSILSKKELEEYVLQMAEKTRSLSKLCQIRSRAEADKYETKLILFQFKEISSIVLDLIDKLSSQTNVDDLYNSAIKLASSEKLVVTQLDELRNNGAIPVYGETLKNNIMALLSGTKKCAQGYMVAVSKIPKSLFVERPGFRLENGKYSSVSKELKEISVNHRLSYSFSASAFVMPQKSLQKSSEVSYADYKLDHVDYDAIFYRRFFYGQDHRNYIGVDDRFGPIAISAKKEVVRREGKADDMTQYRAIFRTKEGCDLRAVFPESSVHILSKMRTKPSWNDVILTINPSVNPAKLRRIDDVKLQDELVRFDEHQLVKRHKFGVLYCKGGQTREEQMFGNENGSDSFYQFLDSIGEKIPLQGWPKHVGGLDKKHNSTGTHAYFAEWRDIEVIFHVSTLLPYSDSPDDVQQIQRKRHIGNDIVCIIFMDGVGQYDPCTIKSQFLHIFIGVQRIKSTTPGVNRYRVEVISNEDVPPFGPDLPKPAEFDEGSELRNFLFCKMINGENAAYKAPKFRDPHVRARQGLVEHLVETFANADQLTSSTSKRTATAEPSTSSAASAAATVAPPVGMFSPPQRREDGPSPKSSEDFKASDLFLSEHRKSMLMEIKQKTEKRSPSS